MTPSSEADDINTTYFWLAEVNVYGVADTLVDGPHDNRESVEKALYIYQQLGLAKKHRRYTCVEVIQTPVLPIDHEIDAEAIAACQEMLRQPRGN